MTPEQIKKHEPMIINGKKYITGVFRGDGGEKMVTHLYEGPFHSPGNPMCSNGWHRKYFDEHGNLVGTTL